MYYKLDVAMRMVWIGPFKIFHFKMLLLKVLRGYYFILLHKNENEKTKYQMVNGTKKCTWRKYISIYRFRQFNIWFDFFIKNCVISFFTSNKKYVILSFEYPSTGQVKWSEETRTHLTSCWIYIKVDIMKTSSFSLRVMRRVSKRSFHFIFV